MSGAEVALRPNLEMGLNMEPGNPKIWTHVDTYKTTITVTDEQVTWEARDLHTDQVVGGGVCRLEKWFTEGFSDIVEEFGPHADGLEIDVARRISRRGAAAPRAAEPTDPDPAAAGEPERAEAPARLAEAAAVPAPGPVAPPSRVPIDGAGDKPDIFTDDEWKDLMTLPFHLFALVAAAEGSITLAEECALLEPWTTRGAQARPLVAQLYGALAREGTTVWLEERALDPEVSATLEQRCIASLKRLPAKEYDQFVLALLAGAVRVARTNEGPLTPQRRVLQEIATRFGVDLRLVMPE